MIGQARFTYTDEDMIATQRAGWTWYAHWRNFLIAYAGIAVFESALLAGLNAAYGTRAAPSEPVFVIVGSAALTVLIFGALFVSARNHGRQVLRSNGLLGGNFAWAWDGSELGGEHTWAWDEDELHMRNERGRADLSWTSVGAWLDAPEVLLLYPSGGRAFTLPERVLAAGWQDAPKSLIFPFGGHAVTLPKRALAAGDAGRLADVLRTAGARERRRFGVIAAKGAGARFISLVALLGWITTGILYWIAAHYLI
jgi:hypothetical protein